MQYTIYELLYFLFLYSFLGWCVEVAYMAVRTGKFCNRGFLNAPVCFSYGILINILILLFGEAAGNYLVQFIFCVVVTSVVTYLSGILAERITGNKLWRYNEISVFSGNKKGLLSALGMGAAAMLTMYLLHPLVFLTCELIPAMVLKIAVIGLFLFFLCDFAAVVYVSRKMKASGKVKTFVEEMQGRKEKLGIRLTVHIWKRLKKAYPQLEEEGKEEENNKKVIFAKGICFDKIIWIFLICALLGDIIETFYVRVTAGIWMSRTSVIYGPFSIVWGLGAVFLTLVLFRLSAKEDRYLFLGGVFIGGTYEYLCSVFTEVVFGTVFWDYSDMPFNIGGRTNLLYCMFWGIAALVWMKLCYPRISKWIEKIPVMIGKIITWTVIFFFICDILISGLAMLRYVGRTENPVPSNTIEEFLDEHYTDELVEFIWPNMKITN